MTMSINNNMLSLNVANLYNKNVVGLQDSMYKVSSGQRINYAGDDPAGMAMSERVRTRIQSTDQANANIQNDNAILKIADSALSNMVDIVSSIREKIVLAANDGTTDADRVRIGLDIDNLATAYDNVVSDTKYGGQQFFVKSVGFQKNGFNVQYGADATDTAKLTFSDLTGATLKIDKATLGSSVIKTGVASSAVAALITKVDGNLSTLQAEQSKLGGYEQRLGYMSDNKTNESAALTELNSSIRDTDMTKGMTEFMKYNIRTQASNYMLAQAGQVPAMVLKLLE